MKSLAMMWRGAEKRGRLVTLPFPSLANLVEVRTGQLVVLAGGPGGGKSLFAANLAWRSPDPILYLAQDDAQSIRDRLSALALSRSLRDFRPEDAGYWAERLNDVDKGSLFLSEGAHTVERIEANIIAFREFKGEYPMLVILDNLKDVHLEGANQGENAFYTMVVPALKNMAAKYDVAFLIMHHVIRHAEGGGKNYGDGATPLTLTSLLFGGERDAAHVWGIFQGYNKECLYVQVLKQRDGEADPKGNLRVRLDWNPESGTLYSR